MSTPIPYLILLAMFGADVASVEFCSGQVIPVTAKKFTESATLIGIILALNPLFSFLVQPYTTWKSDRIWTRWGRRSPFILVGALFLMAAQIYTSFAPGIWVLFVVIIVYQFGQKMSKAPHWILLADILPKSDLGRMSGIRYFTIRITMLFMSYYGLKYMELWEPSPYFFSAGFVMIAFLICLFAVNEPYKPSLPKERFNPLKFVKEAFFTRTEYRQIFGLSFLAWMSMTAFSSFTILFALETIGIGAANYGVYLTICHIGSMAVVLLVGFMMKFTNKRLLLVIGIAALTVAGGMGLYVSTPLGLLAMLIAFQMGWAVVQTVENPFYLGYIPEERRGSIYGALPLIRGLGQTIMFPLVGILKDLMRESLGYRVMFPIVIIFGIASIVRLVTMPDADKVMASRDESGSQDSSE